jgi:Protein of unknown function (DUF3626)
VTFDEYERLANEHLVHLFARSFPFRRIGVRPLLNVFLDGRFKTLFETGRSGGTIQTKYRAQTEKALFDFSLNQDVSSRPIYGYLFASEEGYFDLSRDWALGQYGNVALRFHQQVLEKATFTIGDSLDETSAGMEAAIASSPVLAPLWESIVESMGNILDYPDLDALVRILDSQEKYIEVQYHEINLTDIAEIIFLDAEVRLDLIRLMETTQIPWRVVH